MNWTAEITWANKFFASFSAILPPVVILLNSSPPLAYSITRCILLYVSTTSYNLWKKKQVRIPFFLDVTLSLSKEILTLWGNMVSSSSRIDMFLDILTIEDEDATLPLDAPTSDAASYPRRIGRWATPLWRHQNSLEALLLIFRTCLIRVCSLR